jgi:hypothetical protein
VHHWPDLGARERNANVLGHALVGATLREPANLLDERAAKAGVLAAAAFHEVARPRPTIHVGVAGAEVTLDLAGDGRM